MDGNVAKIDLAARGVDGALVHFNAPSCAVRAVMSSTTLPVCPKTGSTSPRPHSPIFAYTLLRGNRECALGGSPGQHVCARRAGSAVRADQLRPRLRAAGGLRRVYAGVVLHRLDPGADVPLSARLGAFPISRSRAHTHRRHGHPLQTVPSAGLIERPQEKNRVDALR